MGYNRIGTLRTILSFNPYNESISIQSIKIVCALFQHELDLSRAESSYYIWLVNCHFSGSLYLLDADLHSGLHFQDSVIEGNLDAANLQIAGDVIFDETKVGKVLSFRRAKIDGNFRIDGGRFGEYSDRDYSSILDFAHITGDFLVTGERYLGPA